MTRDEWLIQDRPIRGDGAPVEAKTYASAQAFPQASPALPAAPTHASPSPGSLTMRYDMKAFCLDLQDRLNWVFKEMTRLQEENARLLNENKELREEVTLARLFRDLEVANEEIFDLPATVPKEAMNLYHQLPESFHFDEFFRTAEKQGLSGDAARDYMLLYFRETMLQQQGNVLRKESVKHATPIRLSR